MRSAPILLLLSTVLACNTNSSDETKTHKENARSYKHIDSDVGDCGMQDGAHQASVEYTNPTTGYSAEYDLEVQVENCQVIEIDFPKGGYLDLHHIDPTEIDENGDADLTDDRGREWRVHFDSDEKDADENGDHNDSDQEPAEE